MTTDEALLCLSALVAVGHGWNDESVEAYAERLIEWPDAEAACQACDELSVEWKRTSRPPLGVIYEKYQEIVRRKAIDQQNVLPMPTRDIVPFAKGREIAANAYVRQCQRDGREPNWDHFDSFITPVAVKRQRNEHADLTP